MKNNLGKKIVTLLISLILTSISPLLYAKITLQNNLQGLNKNSPAFANATKRLAIKQKNIDQELTPTAIQNFYESAPKEISQALQPFGFFQPEIKSELVHKNDAWTANYNISPGPALTITQLDVKIVGPGIKSRSLNKFLTTFPLHTGEILETEKYEQTKQDLLDVAINHGYLLAKFETSSIQIDLKKYTAAVTLHLDTGVRYKFGAITFNPSPFSQHFLRKFLNFKTGDFYSTPRIHALQNDLSSSNFFTEVTILPQIEKAENGYVPIVVNVVPRKAHQYDFGLGYGTDTGVRGLFGTEFRHVNADGQSFKTMLLASQIISTIEAHYLIPGPHPATDQYDLSAAAQKQNLDHGNSTLVKLSAAYVTKIFKRWQQTLRLTLQNEIYTLDDQPKQHSTFLFPSANWLYTRSNDPLHPTYGNRLSLNIQGSSKKLASAVDFLQATADAKFMRPLPLKSALLLRGSIGYTAVHDLNDLPLSFQYFAGGTQTIRGYSYNSIGPGSTLLVGSIELRHDFFKNWFGAGFFDCGNVSNSFSPKILRGAGIGIGWHSPIGTLELTAARALDLENMPLAVQFSMGPEF
jgi:translocation and assembly module TamA